jgi:hypothetical protein
MAKHSLGDRFRRKRPRGKAAKAETAETADKALSSDMRTLLDSFEADYGNHHQKPSQSHESPAR